jgi:predicted RNA-binding Zn ribbon-like protein
MEAADPRWVWYGGRPSLDFVNTRRDRQEAGAEYLDGPPDLATWLRAAQLVTGRVKVDDTEFAAAVELREAIDAGVHAAVTGTAFPPAALGCLNRWLAATRQQPPQLRAAPGTVAVLDPDSTRPRDAQAALGHIALDAAQLIGTGLRARLRICPGPGCAGRFLDDSPAARRRWCSMAVCGNRQKATTHRHRQP